jgi:uncharacterized protein
MNNPRVIGHIVSVQGFRVKVELLPETKSPLRSTLDGIQIAVAINAYLSFSIGAGQVVVGIITDLESRESYDPSGGDELTLELLKPRRIACVQLLGSIERDDSIPTFTPGITILPTLDTPAEIGAPDILRAIFENPPIRNQPEDYEGTDYDYDLRLGSPTGQPTSAVKASYNDLFSRPLAIVGNTGSGKSFSVASLLQKAMKALNAAKEEPHVFVLDINGEYSKAFPSAKKPEERRPDRIYLNGKEFSIPIWFLNAEEICAWLSASEQTQEPVLKDWWALAKAGVQSSVKSLNRLQNALASIDVLLGELPGLKRKNAASYCDAVCSHLSSISIDTGPFSELFTSHRAIVDKYNADIVTNQHEIVDSAEDLRVAINELLVGNQPAGEKAVRTADSPLFVSRQTLNDPTMINRAVSKEDSFRVEAHLTTLKLRLKTRLDDKRWRAFLNYEETATAVPDLAAWFGRLGIGGSHGPKISILDLSMLSNEVLPFACSVLGRIFLEVRERLAAGERFRHPWVLVLEEAHNYARPIRADEDRGHRLARLSFERIAKEGRKFGLSLIIASQRPSEISATIISQCANFISHRLQNPDDIEHFRRIIPIQARRLLDQVTILASGEAIVFGSAFHVPARVQFDRPEPSPYSQTAAPFHEWSKEEAPFPLPQVLSAWGITDSGPTNGEGNATYSAGEGSLLDIDEDDIPF